MGEMSVAYRVLVGKPEGNNLLERARRRWLNNIKLDLKWHGGVYWINPAWDTDK
jgi:hypothetical protein